METGVVVVAVVCGSVVLALGLAFGVLNIAVHAMAAVAVPARTGAARSPQPVALMSPQPQALQSNLPSAA